MRAGVRRHRILTARSRMSSLYSAALGISQGLKCKTRRDMPTILTSHHTEQ